MNRYVQSLQTVKEFFDRSTSALKEEDSAFVPGDGMLTAAEQVAHVAETVDWFMAGGFGTGFDMDFAAGEKRVRAFKSLTAARKHLDRAMADACARLEKATDDEMNALLPENPILGACPRHLVLWAISDHTAHHRGSLAVYTRLLGRVPPMPYM